jgi:ribosome-binding factor A
MSRRTQQMASEIHKAIQEVIDRGLHDPRISGLITVTGVRVTDDLKSAFVEVSILPGEKQTLTMHGLRAAARHIRRQVGDLIAIKQMPEVVFRLDESLKKQAGVLDAISRAVAEREAREARGADSGADPDSPAPFETRPDTGSNA